MLHQRQATPPKRLSFSPRINKTHKNAHPHTSPCSDLQMANCGTAVSVAFGVEFGMSRRRISAVSLQRSDCDAFGAGQHDGRVSPLTTRGQTPSQDPCCGAEHKRPCPPGEIFALKRKYIISSLPSAIPSEYRADRQTPTGVGCSFPHRERELIAVSIRASHTRFATAVANSRFRSTLSGLAGVAFGSQ